MLVGRDQEHLGELSRFLSQAEPELNTAQAKESAARAILEQAETAMAGWQQRWEAFSLESAEAMRASEVEQARIEQINAGLQRLKSQRERLTQERSQLEGSMSGAKPDEFAAAEREARERGREAQAELEAALASLHALRDAERQGAAALDAAKAELQSARSEYLTVEAVQKAALGKGQAETSEWLAGRKLDASPRLAQRLEVDKGWERAVETALGSYLEAVCVDEIDAVAESMDSLGSGQLTIAEARPSDGVKPDAESLAARVAGPAVMTGLLGGVLAVESLADAVSRRKSLRPGQSVIARNGIWLGRDWVRVARSEAGHAGVISREQELKTLHKAVTGRESRVADLESKLAETRLRLAALDSSRDALHAKVNQLHHDLVNVRGAHEAIRSKTQQITERVARLIEESAQVDADIARDEADSETCGSRLAVAREGQRALQLRGPGLERERDALRDGLICRARTARQGNCRGPTGRHQGRVPAFDARHPAYEPRSRQRPGAPAAGAPCGPRAPARRGRGAVRGAGRPIAGLPGTAARGRARPR